MQRRAVILRRDQTLLDELVCGTARLSFLNTQDLKNLAAIELPRL